MKYQHSKDRFYRIWTAIVFRCNKKTASNFKNYGGRGIKCEWNSFEEFKADMFESYKNGLTIERKDNNKGYSKENCRWATYQEQANNKRSNHYLEFKGIKKSIADWAREFNLTYDTLKLRIKRGWTVERALTTKRLINQFI